MYVGATTQVDLSSMHSQGCVFHNVIILILTVYYMYMLVQGYGVDAECMYISENIIGYLRLVDSPTCKRYGGLTPILI